MSEAKSLADYELARRMHGALWAAGDYTRVAKQLTGVSAAVVQAAGIGPGLRVLDLGAGSGNTALLAAGRGAEVTAVDLTGDLFGTCRQRAAAAGVTVTWAAANPEDLPFGAGDFDRVLSAAARWRWPPTSGRWRPRWRGCAGLAGCWRWRAGRPRAWSARWPG